MTTKMELMEKTRAELHAQATELGWETSRGNKEQLIDFILERLASTGETGDESDDTSDAVAAATSTELTEESANELTQKQLREMLVAGGAKAAEVNKMKKAELVALVVPHYVPEPEPEPTLEEREATFAGVLGAAVPTLLAFLAVLRDRIREREPELNTNMGDTSLLYIAGQVLEDCRLRGNVKAALAAIHIRVSAHNRRLRTVIRRVVNTDCTHLHRHVRFAFLDECANALPLFFTRDEAGEEKLEALFAELESYYDDNPPTHASRERVPPVPEGHDAVPVDTFSTERQQHAVDAEEKELEEATA